MSIVTIENRSGINIAVHHGGAADNLAGGAARNFPGGGIEFIFSYIDPNYYGDNAGFQRYSMKRLLSNGRFVVDQTGLRAAAGGNYLRTWVHNG